MNDIIELIIILTIVMSYTLMYKLSPFKVWRVHKPKFVFFPKYIVNYDKPIWQIESSLKRLKFNKMYENKYSRGKIFGDFTAKSIKLTVEINHKKKQIKIYSSPFGILFDTGDIWRVTSEIINES